MCTDGFFWKDGLRKKMESEKTNLNVFQKVLLPTTTSSLNISLATLLLCVGKFVHPFLHGKRHVVRC